MKNVPRYLSIPKEHRESCRAMAKAAELVQVLCVHVLECRTQSKMHLGWGILTADPRDGQDCSSSRIWASWNLEKLSEPGVAELGSVLVEAQLCMALEGTWIGQDLLSHFSAGAVNQSVSKGDFSLHFCHNWKLSSPGYMACETTPVILKR